MPNELPETRNAVGDFFYRLDGLRSRTVPAQRMSAPDAGVV